MYDMPSSHRLISRPSHKRQMDSVEVLIINQRVLLHAWLHLPQTDIERSTLHVKAGGANRGCGLHLLHFKGIIPRRWVLAHTHTAHSDTAQSCHTHFYFFLRRRSSIDRRWRSGEPIILWFIYAACSKPNVTYLKIRKHIMCCSPVASSPALPCLVIGTKGLLAKSARFFLLLLVWTLGLILVWHHSKWPCRSLAKLWKQRR